MNSYVLCVRNKMASGDESGGEMGAATYLRIGEADSVPRPSHMLGGVRERLEAIVEEASPVGAAPDDVLAAVRGGPHLPGRFPSKSG